MKVHRKARMKLHRLAGVIMYHPEAKEATSSPTQPGRVCCVSGVNNRVYTVENLPSHHPDQGSRKYLKPVKKCWIGMHGPIWEAASETLPRTSRGSAGNNLFSREHGGGRRIHNPWGVNAVFRSELLPVREIASRKIITAKAGIPTLAAHSLL